MDFVTVLTAAVAFIAIGLIMNLFISLRRTDAEIKEVLEPEPVVEKKPKKPEKVKTKVKQSKPTEFKHKALLVNLKGHAQAAASGVFSSSGKYAASCDSEKSLYVWLVKDFNKGNTHVRVTTEYDPVLSVSFSPDSKALIAALEKSNTTRVYKLQKKSNHSIEVTLAAEVADLNKEAGLVKAKIAVQLSSGVQTGAYLYHEYHDSTVVLTDLRGVELARIKCQGGEKRQIQLSNCGRYIAVCGDSPELRAWTVVFKSGKFIEVRRLPSLCGHKPRILKFSFSPDSRRLITLDAQDNIKVWDMEPDWANQQTPRELFTFKNPFGLPNTITISPDNHTVAFAQFNKLITFDLNDVKTFNVIENIFTSSIVNIDFTPDSEFLAVTGDKLVRVLHNVTGWRARLSDYEKRLQLASSEVHRHGLEEDIKNAKTKVAQF